MSEEKKPNRKRRAADELVDIDYWDKLSAKDREWLNDFVKHHYYAYTDPLASEKDNKSNRDRSRRIRRDLWNTQSQYPLYDKQEPTTNPEEAVVDFIDYKLLDKKANGEEQ